MKYSATDEQQAILDTVVTDIDGKVLSIIARAGCTKSSTACMMVNTVKPKRALYFAFNKGIVEEGKELFSSNVECKTLHALAYKYILPGSIEDFTYLCITENLSYPNKLEIINGIDEFFRSSSINMHKFLPTVMQPNLVPIAVKYIEMMLEDKIPHTFNFLLKMFHIMLADGDIEVEYDMVILDEAGDTTAVAVEIFKLLKSPKKIMLGDDYQTIYGFMNLVNGFKLVDNPIHMSLTKSFRCNESIAKRIEGFCRQNIYNHFVFKGFNRPETITTKMYVSATNAALVERIHTLQQEGIRYKLLRDTKDIFAAPFALVTASAGKDVYHKKYKFLNVEYKNYTMSSYRNFFSYLKKEVKDEEIHSAIDVISKFNNKNINIFEVYKKANEQKADPNIIVCTAFTSKGLEADYVHLEDDINSRILDIIDYGGAQNDDEFTMLKLGYVAMSRAKFVLENCKFA